MQKQVTVTGWIIFEYTYGHIEGLTNVPVVPKDNNLVNLIASDCNFEGRFNNGHDVYTISTDHC